MIASIPGQVLGLAAAALQNRLGCTLKMRARSGIVSGSGSRQRLLLNLDKRQRPSGPRNNAPSLSPQPKPSGLWARRSVMGGERACGTVTRQLAGNFYRVPDSPGPQIVDACLLERRPLLRFLISGRPTGVAERRRVWLAASRLSKPGGPPADCLSRDHAPKVPRPGRTVTTTSQAGQESLSRA